MENLEEVLHALDEFQKMRPSEIPRELEDYLCWVAKTGDPVYQWPLIKTLFREKLTRVMTDFYESCPTLDLAPCPNVEHFNYDTMKSNLLERLESFANAPFTVQRICELLTAPRKEYNRVDKFMRAIEKNILVVSTREPGPLARRNENGDSMVNGSVDDDASVTQQPQDVDMEYWEKDCPSTVTISVHTVENETPLMQTIVPNTAVVKNVFGSEDLSNDKVESASSKSSIVVPNFIPSNSEFSDVSNLNTQTETQDTQIGSTVQNLSAILPETSGIVSDVSEAIMNEDTSSQPSLELGNESGDAIESLKKVQTSFHTKDFGSNENKSSNLHIDHSKLNEQIQDRMEPIQIQEESCKTNGITVTAAVESKALLSNNNTINAPDVNPSKSNENLEVQLKLASNAQSLESNKSATASVIEHKALLSLEDINRGTSSAMNNSDQFSSKMFLSSDSINTEQTANELVDMCTGVENLKDESETTDSEEKEKPVVEKPHMINNQTQDLNDKQRENLVIAEATVDETRVIKSIVPDTNPSLDEPKDIEPHTTKDETQNEEISEDLAKQNCTITCELESKEEISSTDTVSTEVEDNNATSVASKMGNSETIIQSVISKKGDDALQLMEVDEEETISVLKQIDEPMEEESSSGS